MRLDSDPEIETRQALLEQLTAVALPALRRLADAVSGEQPMRTDMELRTCLAAARLARILLLPLPQGPEPLKSIIHPSVSPEEARRLVAVLQNKKGRLPSADVSSNQ